MAEKSAYNCSQLTAHSSPRIVSLDTAKGLAIILVIIGHELQHRYGTDALAFRLLYSFHMPLFMFLSGMVFSLKLKDFPSQSLDPLREILKSSRGLLVPFVCWTLLYAVIHHRDDMAGYLVSVAESPDRSLWFLLVLFWCRMFFVLVHAAVAKAFRNLTVSVLAVMMLVIFAAIRPLMPGSFMGAALFLAHFPYFALGVFMWQYRAKLSGFLSDIPAILAMIALFAVIAPCWYLVCREAWQAVVRCGQEGIANSRNIPYVVVDENSCSPCVLTHHKIFRLHRDNDARNIRPSLPLSGIFPARDNPSVSKHNSHVAYGENTVYTYASSRQIINPCYNPPQHISDRRNRKCLTEWNLQKYSLIHRNFTRQTQYCARP